MIPHLWIVQQSHIRLLALDPPLVRVWVRLVLGSPCRLSHWVTKLIMGRPRVDKLMWR